MNKKNLPLLLMLCFFAASCLCLFFLILNIFTDAKLVSAENLGNAFDIQGIGGYQNVSNTSNPLNPIITKIIRMILSFVGIIFLILMVYGGYLWMSDQGNEEQVKKAKDLISAAIIGLIIVASAYALSYLIIKTFAKSTLNDQRLNLEESK